MNILKILYQTNKTLTSRIQQSEWFYSIWIVVVCLFLAGFGGSLNFMIEISPQEARIVFNLLAFLLVMLDVSATLLKFGNRAMIEPRHLRIFPLSRWKLFKFQSLLLALDIKSFMVVTVILVSSLFFVLQSQYTAAIVSPLFWMLLWTNLIAFTLVVYRMAGKWLNRYRKNVTSLSLIFICIILGAVITDSEIIFTQLPIVSFAGNGLFGLFISDIWFIWTNIFYLLVSCICALALLSWTSSNY